MSIFPIDASKNTIVDTVKRVNDKPIFKELAWDFDKDTFLMNADNFIVLEKDEALLVWIYKALKTQRYKFLAYSLSYGLDAESVINKGLSSDLATAELTALINACLNQNSYIKSINSVEVSIDESIVTGTIYITTEYTDNLEVKVDVNFY